MHRTAQAWRAAWVAGRVLRPPFERWTQRVSGRLAGFCGAGGLASRGSAATPGSAVTLPGLRPRLDDEEPLSEGFGIAVASVLTELDARAHQLGRAHRIGPLDEQPQAPREIGLAASIFHLAGDRECLLKVRDGTLPMSERSAGDAQVAQVDLLLAQASCLPGDCQSLPVAGLRPLHISQCPLGQAKVAQGGALPLAVVDPPCDCQSLLEVLDRALSIAELPVA